MEPTITVYDGTDYLIRYDFEHMGYILSSKSDTSFLECTKHFHKLMAYLRDYQKLNISQIQNIAGIIVQNFMKLSG